MKPGDKAEVAYYMRNGDCYYRDPFTRHLRGPYVGKINAYQSLRQRYPEHDFKLVNLLTSEVTI